MLDTFITSVSLPEAGLARDLHSYQSLMKDYIISFFYVEREGVAAENPMYQRLLSCDRKGDYSSLLASFLAGLLLALDFP